MAKINELNLYRKDYKIYDETGNWTGEYQSLWAFDDEEKGINGEPFMMEASAAISALVWPGAKTAKIVFSRKPFDGWTIKLTKSNSTPGGGTFYDTFGGRRVWLCRVLKRYFWLRPKTIYVRAFIGTDYGY